MVRLQQHSREHTVVLALRAVGETAAGVLSDLLKGQLRAAEDLLIDDAMAFNQGMQDISRNVIRRDEEEAKLNPEHVRGVLNFTERLLDGQMTRQHALNVFYGLIDSSYNVSLRAVAPIAVIPLRLERRLVQVLSDFAGYK